MPPQTDERQLFWYRLITLIWFPIQFALVYGLLWWVTRADHLDALEKIGLFFGLGVITGTIGINYSHELMHQKNRLERWLGDLLLAMVLYSHFRSEHLLVHHRHVGTPRDTVTARYNESFHHFFPRVLRESLPSAMRAEAEIGGAEGLALFLLQAGVAVWQLELVNYVEHYGLTRKHLGDGRYEPVRPHHSWNAAHRASNWLLINLQRHSDHHVKPARRFPLLQNYDESEAPHPTTRAKRRCRDKRGPFVI